jgi:hypothetical protein
VIFLKQNKGLIFKGRTNDEITPLFQYFGNRKVVIRSIILIRTVVLNLSTFKNIKLGDQVGNPATTLDVHKRATQGHREANLRPRPPGLQLQMTNKQVLDYQP